MPGNTRSSYRPRYINRRRYEEQRQAQRQFNTLVIGSMLLVISVLAGLYVIEKRYQQIDRENQEQIRWNCFSQASLDSCHPVART